MPQCLVKCKDAFIAGFGWVHFENNNRRISFVCLFVCFVIVHSVVVWRSLQQPMVFITRAPPAAVQAIFRDIGISFATRSINKLTQSMILINQSRRRRGQAARRAWPAGAGVGDTDVVRATAEQGLPDARGEAGESGDQLRRFATGGR